MFPELSKYLDEVEGEVESTSGFLRKLNGARIRLRNAIAEAEQQTSGSTTDTNKLFAKVHRAVKKEALSMVKRLATFNVRHALGINEEFDAPAYRRHLYTAIENSNTYLVRTIGTGINATMKVDMNLDKTAGRLDRWAAGVKAYRKILEQEREQKRKEAAESKKKRYRKYVYNPIRASAAWAGIYERREGLHSTFSETIRARLQFSGAMAPFWQLLDKGEVPMKSDRGGYPTPSKSPTHFVKDTEDEVNTYIDNALIEKRKEYYDSLKEYREFLAQAKERLTRLDNLAAEIRLELGAVKKLQAKLERSGKETDITKLQKAVQLVKNNEKNAGRVNVGPKGKRTYLSVETIRELL